jgi:hypothetical protein
VPNIVLNEEFHTYQDAETGRIIPDSCTGLVKKLGFSDPSPFYTEYGRNRGTLAHKVARLFLEGDLDEETVDPVLAPYFHAVLSFLVDTGFVVTRSEFILYSEKWDFAATVDFEGYYPVAPSILYLGDWKTGTMMDWVRYQLILEKIALGEHRQRIGVNLKGNGKYKAKHFDNPLDEQEVLWRLKNYKEADPL